VTRPPIMVCRLHTHHTDRYHLMYHPLFQADMLHQQSIHLHSHTCRTSRICRTSLSRTSRTSLTNPEDTRTIMRREMKDFRPVGLAEERSKINSLVSQSLNSQLA
jgi:hypothetical protein